MNSRVKRVMTIGGSDSSGGAGIQADIRTFSALGVYGASVITAITSQNSYGVQEKKEVPPEIIKAQIESIMNDPGFSSDYAKTGMLYTSEIIKVVASELKKYDLLFVLDPVIKASSGGLLLENRALGTLIKHLLPICTVVTPNVEEASIVSGVEIKDKESAKEAAVKIFKTAAGANAVIITGGHLIHEIRKGRATDLIYNGKFEEISFEFVKGRSRSRRRKVHGAGCTFSAVLAAELAKGKNIRDAALFAKKFVYNAISGGTEISDLIVANQFHPLYKDASRYYTLENTKEAVRLLKEEKSFLNLIPEVGTNIGMAIEGASDKMDIAAVDGRIFPMREGVRAGCVNFGTSDHIARMILAAMHYDKEKRSAINIKYSPEIIEACNKSGMIISYFKREKEGETSKEEGRTMEWGIKEAVKEKKKAGVETFPDVIYDLGVVGKETMVRILGNTAVEVAFKVKKIIEVLAGVH